MTGIGSRDTGCNWGKGTGGKVVGKDLQSKINHQHGESGLALRGTRTESLTHFIFTFNFFLFFLFCLFCSTLLFSDPA